MSILDQLNLEQLNILLLEIQDKMVTLTGTETLTNKTLTSPTITSPTINTSISGTAFLDEDNMASDSATKVASQQSIKAYADTKIAKSTGTAKGDLIVYSASGTPTNVAVGANYSVLQADSAQTGGVGYATNVCRIKTGTYTGDGGASKAITGVGFQPKYVKIFVHPAAEGFVKGTYEKLDQSWSTYALTGNSYDAAPYDWSPWTYSSLIISLDSDGFTVGDKSADLNPNKNGIVYDYLCLG